MKLVKSLGQYLLFAFGIIFFYGNPIYAQKIELPDPSLTFQNKWAVQLKPGESIEQVTANLNAQVVGQIGTLEDYYLLTFNEFLDNPNIVDAQLNSNTAVVWQSQQVARQMAKKNWNDPQLGNQWHLNNTGQGGGTVGVDANVFAAWDLGVSGNGVQICIVDDGLERNHDDLSPNFVLADSRDLNGSNGNDPSPTNAGDNHGTGCAGVAAAKGNNNIGVSGVAYDANLSGVRLIAAPNTDADEATALTLNNNNNDIYSNSWGPTDNGVYSCPGLLAKAALETGALNGRNGLGSIFTWAAGNGRASNDNSNYDGYVNSIYTVGVGAHADNGIFSWYSEPGASMLISAPSNGGTAGITTTDVNNGYRDDFGGTSSATPLVSGVIALMLEANPNLTWRDVQHILVENGTMIDAGNADWTQNGAGKPINHAYGFGGVDAAAVVQAAQNWANVSDAVADTSAVVAVNQIIPDGSGSPGYGASLSRTLNVNSDILLEQVELKVNITHTWRGDLRVRLTSPSGTESILAEQHNDSNANLDDWYYMTVRNWGESSMGDWTLTVDDGFAVDVGTWVDFQLILHGTPNDACVATMEFDNMEAHEGDYQASQSITSNGSVADGVTVNFEAGDFILLTDGFLVADGGIFSATIEDCATPVLLSNAATSRNSNEKPILAIPEKVQQPALTLYPNPVTYQSNLALNLPKEEPVSIYLMDAYGRRVGILKKEQLLTAGRHDLILNINDFQLQSGIYLVVSKIGSLTLVNKVSFIR